MNLDRKFIIVNEPFSHKLVVVVGTHQYCMEQTSLQCLCEEDNAGTFHFVDSEDYLFIRCDEELSFMINTAVHEVVHLVNHMLQHRRIPIGKQNEEVVAYLVAFYSEKIVENLIKNGESRLEEL
jgi:hypothetical protein